MPCLESSIFAKRRARCRSSAACRASLPVSSTPIAWSKRKMSWRVMTSPSMPSTSVTWVMRRRPSLSRRLLHDQVDGGGHLLADGPDRQVEAGHQHHGLEAGERVAGAVGVHRGRASRRGRCSWPAACRGPRASRTSPTTMRSGRMRRAFVTRSRIVTSPRPSMLGGRASRRSTWSWCSWSSAASSMVTMRSSVGMNDDSTFSVVVLPVPVPPETMMLSRPVTQAVRGSRRGAGRQRAEPRSGRRSV